MKVYNMKLAGGKIRVIADVIIDGEVAMVHMEPSVDYQFFLMGDEWEPMPREETESLQYSIALMLLNKEWKG